MTMINYPALFVTLAMILLLLVHAVMPSAMLAFAFVILMSLAITADIFYHVENRGEHRT